MNFIVNDANTSQFSDDDFLSSLTQKRTYIEQPNTIDYDEELNML